MDDVVVVHSFYVPSLPPSLSRCVSLCLTHMPTYNVLFFFSKHYESPQAFSFLETFFLWLYFCSVNRLLCEALYRLTVCVLDCAFLATVHCHCTVCVFTIVSLNSIHPQLLCDRVLNLLKVK